MPIKITLNSATSETLDEKPIQASVGLKISKTLDGNLLVNDHKYMDILVMPDENRVVTIPKPEADRDVYPYQKHLMYSLFKGGITDALMPTGGPVFGMVETTYPAQSGVNPLEAVLLQISEFLKRTSADEEVADEYDKNIEDNFTEPPPDETTEYGSIPPYQDTPGANQIGDPTYTFAGYGYIY
jgi:hypothetical protein